jgi:hypothetical protein
MTVVSFVDNFAVFKIYLMIIRPSMFSDVRPVLELFNISQMFLLSGVEGSACLTDVVPWAVRAINLIYM